MGVQINGDTGNVIATKGTYSGNVTIGGTLTYEDVTNIDSVGLVTARNGIEIGARPGVAASISVDGNAIFSGITTVGGNLSIADKIIHTGNTDTSIRFPEGNTISAEINGSEALRVGAGGSVGIGTDVPDTLLHLYGSSNTQKLLTFGGGNSKRNNYIGISGADNLEIGVDEHDEGSGSTFRIRIDGAEKARITSGGLLCVGHDASTASGKIQASTAGQDGIDILGYNSTAGNGGRLTFYRSKNATIGSNTEVADGDSLGRIDWRGYNDDGTAFNIGATIEAEVDGTIDSTTDMPSALLFKTSADGSSSPTERLQITSTGNIISNGGSTARIAWGTTGGVLYSGFSRYDGAAQDVGISHYATTNAGTSFVEHFRMEHNGTLKGTDTSIGSLSDIRLKKDIKDYSYDISKFKQFKPKSFNWINPEVHGDKSNVKGFIAQDIELVDKDWVEDSWIRKDDPDYDLVKETSTVNGVGEDVGVSKISKFGYKDAMYISVIQQLISRIETLESS